MKYCKAFTLSILLSLSATLTALPYKSCMHAMPSMLPHNWQAAICKQLSHIEAKHGHTRKQITSSANSVMLKIQQRISSVASRTNKI